MLWQPSLPKPYLELAPEELAARITDRRRRLGDRLVILGHHYQTDEVIAHADITGDSLKLSQQAAALAAEGQVEHVVFCGVHFMAETADMLTPDTVRVILPDLSAGCSMADMAGYEETVEAWELLHESLSEQGWAGRIIPITYVNSTAAIKAFVGEHGGACCTSSNADQVFRWAMAGGTRPAEPGEDIKILFLPDQHLGRNTAAAYGIDTARHAPVYDPKRTARGEPLGGMTDDELLDAGAILWAGHCSVHKLFRPEHVGELRDADDNARAADPNHTPTTVIVHPECCKEVVDLADLSGSTEMIINTLRAADPGTRWAVGTEVHLVNRLAEELRPRGVEVRILSDCQCLCTTMYRVDQPHLLWVLDGLCGLGTATGKTPDKIELADITPGDSPTDEPGASTDPGASTPPGPGPTKARNVIAVHPEVREPALLALDRMLAHTGGTGPRGTPPAPAPSLASSPR